MKRLRPKYVLLASAVFLWMLVRTSGAVASAQDLPVPVTLHPSLLLKILSFDRNIEESMGPEIVVGVIYQSRFRASYVVKETFMETVAAASPAYVKHIPVQYIPIELERADDLPAELTQHHVDVLYIAPIRAIAIEKIAAVTRAHQVLTFTGVPAYVQAGLTVSIDLHQNKPKILINLPAARAEGITFNAHLLKLAEVIQD